MVWGRCCVRSSTWLRFVFAMLVKSRNGIFIGIGTDQNIRSIHYGERFKTEFVQAVSLIVFIPLKSNCIKNGRTIVIRLLFLNGKNKDSMILCIVRRVTLFTRSVTATNSVHYKFRRTLFLLFCTSTITSNYTTAFVMVIAIVCVVLGLYGHRLQVYPRHRQTLTFP